MKSIIFNIFMMLSTFITTIFHSKNFISNCLAIICLWLNLNKWRLKWKNLGNVVLRSKKRWSCLTSAELAVPTTVTYMTVRHMIHMIWIYTVKFKTIFEMYSNQKVFIHKSVNSKFCESYKFVKWKFKIAVHENETNSKLEREKVR